MLVKKCNTCAASHAATAAVAGLGSSYKRKHKRRSSRGVRGVNSAEIQLLAAGIGGAVTATLVDKYALSKLSFVEESPILRALIPGALGAAMALGFVGKNNMVKAAGLGMAAKSLADYFADMAGIKGIGNSEYTYPGSTSEVIHF